MSGKGIYASLRELAEYIEDKWKVAVFLTHNQSRIQTDSFVQKTYFLCICGLDLENPPPDLETKVHEIIEWQRTDCFTNNNPYYIRISCIESPKAWFESYANDSLRAARGDSDVSDLWAPVVYGKDRIQYLITCAQQILGEDIIQRWRQERRKWQQKVSAELRHYNREIKRKYEVAKMPLNSFEVKDIHQFLESARDAYTSGRTFFIGVDGSGRPIAKAIGWYLEELGLQVEIDFLDPHALRERLRIQHEDTHDHYCKIFAQALRAENPNLFEMLCKNSEQVTFVEDQVGYGSTSETLRIFLDFLASGQTRANLLPMTSFSSETPPPSWHYNKNLQGIIPVSEDKVSMTAQELETSESIDFYTKLEICVRDFARKSKKRILAQTAIT